VMDAQRILGLPEDESQDFYLRGFSSLAVRSGETGNENIAPQDTTEDTGKAFTPSDWIRDALCTNNLKSADWTEEMKVAYWKRQDRQRVGWWGLAYQKVEPLYFDEAEAVEKAIKKGDMLKSAEKAINGLSEQWSETMKKLTFSIVDHFGREVGPETMGKANQEFDPTSRLIRAWIAKHAADSVNHILVTNLEDVKRVILAGTEDNLTVSQIAKNLRQTYLDHSPFKAMRTARTEVTQSAGFAQHESAKQGGVMKKHIWLSSRDDRVRDAHAAIDGESRALDEPYSNGLMYPGDSSGDPAETIQCRCAERFAI